jgi:hypothetical protein
VSCSSGAACCDGLICLPGTLPARVCGPCRQLGDLCEHGGNCCSGACTVFLGSGFCCLAAGRAGCSTDWDCCSGATCDAGTCR